MGGWKDEEALGAAIRAGNKTEVMRLLDNGTNVDCKFMHGCTALMVAASMSKPTSMEIMKLLLERGANVEVKAEKGMTALMWAADCGRTDYLKLLLDHGAKIDASDYMKMTACDHARSAGHQDAAKMLLQYGKSGRSSSTSANGGNAETWRAAFQEISKVMEQSELDLDSTATLCSELLGDRVSFDKIMIALKAKGNETFSVNDFVLVMKQLSGGTKEWKAAFREICEVMEEEELDLETTATVCAELLGDRVPFDTIKTTLKKKDKDGNESFSLIEFILTMKQLSM
uniref:Rhodanese domain-containing protein n=1 Tax=Timspurckia oligopyrenoides TaxID=708627 RepID=A0A7S0ZGW5_9RHOD|mmetsp:Transcript_48/g.79  ORF Transcript_48/g.79 Transcript_48/m.79 type:complete len:286 (+) Transcript_48:121-978(+)